MDTVGYGVFEVPLVARKDFESVDRLRKARRYIHRLLIREFKSRGVSRWHFYGDGKIAEFTSELQFEHYHPHLNVLIDHGFIGKKQLKRIRRLWSQWVYRQCGKRYYKTAPVYYRYNKAPGKRWHLIRYITRSTFKELNEANRHIAHDLFGFNNTSWFGTFNASDKAKGRERFEAWVTRLPQSSKRSVVEVAAQEAFTNGLCPICGAVTKLVMGVQRCDDLEFLRDFGGGLYEVRAPPWSWVYDCEHGLEGFKVEDW
ncbi:hypothetical protein ES703_34340 [subsurface metagenome]